VRLDERYRVLQFADADEIGEQDVIDFWDREAGLPSSVIAERIDQLAWVALERDAGLAGVSTTYLARNEQLRTQMWHYRTFVGAAHRYGNLARHLLLQTTLELEERFVSGRDTRAPGMVMHIEHEGMKRRWNYGVWVVVTDVDYEGPPWPFIGENERGDHVRVHWFPGAQAPLPD
jgi:hypothetical protein